MKRSKQRSSNVVKIVAGTSALAGVATVAAATHNHLNTNSEEVPQTEVAQSIATGIVTRQADEAITFKPEVKETIDIKKPASPVAPVATIVKEATEAAPEPIVETVYQTVQETRVETILQSVEEIVEIPVETVIEIPAVIDEAGEIIAEPTYEVVQDVVYETQIVEVPVEVETIVEVEVPVEIVVEAETTTPEALVAEAPAVEIIENEDNNAAEIELIDLYTIDGETVSIAPVVEEVNAIIEEQESTLGFEAIDEASTFTGYATQADHIETVIDASVTVEPTVEITPEIVEGVMEASNEIVAVEAATGHVDVPEGYEEVIYTPAGEVSASEATIVYDNAGNAFVSIGVPDHTGQANTYPIGQCTWGVKELAPWVGNWWGNGQDWSASAASQGFTVGTTPQVGAVAVWSGANGYGGGYGHVALVTGVDGDNIQVYESNVNGNMYIANHRAQWYPDGYFNAAADGVTSYIYAPAGY